MSEKLPTRFPTHADDFPMFVEYEADEVAPTLLMFIIGIATKVFLLIVLGIALSYFYTLLKDRKPNRFIFAFLYHIGLLGRKGSLPGYIKTFLE
ncbi:type IV conjugative transfer system protein TraL [Persephonella sp. KM09-Lau-8]|uniref:type IV conjugative transfer system protein TraL n=1 Tax=Persephonella sp. KM09-Lau-8 TaxID=1158345 RepID=UPI00049672DE|nr:type IV conjugative transfer system protein TraL [Persephonella sp. KM09-Lau-8]